MSGSPGTWPNLPAVRDEPARGAMALDDVVERTNSFKLGHVQAGSVGCLQQGAKLGFASRVEGAPDEAGWYCL